MGRNGKRVDTESVRSSERSDRIDAMLKDGFAIYSANPTEGSALARRALRLSVMAKDRLRMGQCKLLLGLSLRHLSDNAMAITTLQEGADLSSEVGDYGRASQSLQQIGIIRTGSGEYPAALATLMEALDLARLSGDLSRQGSIHNSIGVIYFNMADYTNALKYYHASLNFSKEGDDSPGQAHAINNLGTVYMALNDHVRAGDQFRRFKELAEKYGHKRLLCAALMNIGLVFQRERRFDEALEYYNEAGELITFLQDQPVEAYRLNCLGILYRDRGELPAALECMERGLEISIRIEDALRWAFLGGVGEIRLLLDPTDTTGLVLVDEAMEGMLRMGDRNGQCALHGVLAKHYERSGEAEKALEHHKIHMQIKEEMVGIEQQRAMVQLEMRNQIERNEHERELLKQKAAGLEVEVEKKGKELTTMALHLVEKNQFLDALKREMSEVARSAEGKSRPAMRGLIRQMDGKLNNDEEWDSFEKQFELIHHDFIRTLLERSPELTRTELKVCALLKINLSTKEIASILATTSKTIDNHRYNIRKKLVIPAETKIGAYMVSI